MTYSQMRQLILKEFQDNGFYEKWKSGKTNTEYFRVPNDYDIDLVVSYPGLKTKEHTYDYRVEINGIAISHANIITDIYNKASQRADMADDMESFLYDIAVNALDYDKPKYEALFRVDFHAPPECLLQCVATAHGEKHFQIEGNQDIRYSFDELAHAIGWIVLQEDINYPKPRYEGRSMPFCRYIEAIYCAKHPEDAARTLAMVIGRAIRHERARPWAGCGIGYGRFTRLT